MTPSEQAERIAGSFQDAIHVAQCAVAQWGPDAQTAMVIEECGELLTAIARVRRGRASAQDVGEESADVVLVAMTEGIARIGLMPFLNILSEKVARLAMRLQKKDASTS